MKKTTPLKNWAKDLNRHFTKDNMKIQIYKKILNILGHYGITKRDTTTHVLQLLKFKTLRTPKADKDELLQELALVAGRDVKWYSQPPWK